jgi:hypothetical protein
MDIDRVRQSREHRGAEQQRDDELDSVPSS